jgi:hypothetical protein
MGEHIWGQMGHKVITLKTLYSMNTNHQVPEGRQQPLYICVSEGLERLFSND